MATYERVLKRFSDKVKQDPSNIVYLSMHHGDFEYAPGRVVGSCNVDISGSDCNVSSTYFLVYELVPNLGSLVMQRRTVNRALSAAKFLRETGLVIDLTPYSIEEIGWDVARYDEMIRGIEKTIMYKRFLQDHPTKNLWKIGLRNNFRFGANHEKF